MDDRMIIDSSPVTRLWTFSWRAFLVTLAALSATTMLLRYGLYVGPVCGVAFGVAGMLRRRPWGLSLIAATALYATTMALIAVTVMNATVSSGT